MSDNNNNNNKKKKSSSQMISDLSSIFTKKYSVSEKIDIAFD
jgi:hypothetical protein